MFVSDFFLSYALIVKCTYVNASGINETLYIVHTYCVDHLAAIELIQRIFV